MPTPADTPPKTPHRPPCYHPPVRPLLALLLLLPAAAQAQAPASPQAQPQSQPAAIAAAIRADRWAEADALAARSPDPLAAHLATFYRLLTPGGGRAAEIAAFMAAHPDWPQQAQLAKRLQEALALDKDIATVLDICRTAPPQSVPSMLRCADAATQANLPDPGEQARRAWVAGIADPAAEAAFLKRWAAILTPDDQWRRFDRLAWSDSPAPNGPAARQIPRLPQPLRPAAEARLALRRDDPTAPALVRALPEPARSDPALVLELARWYRRAGQDKDAARVWSGPGAAAELAAPPDRAPAFWDERNLLARRLLRADDPALAYQVAAPPAAAPAAALDQAFLAGWIALRRLNQPDAAAGHFRHLATLSPAALTQSRAYYWLGRSLQGDQAEQALQTAAQWPTTFYGQLAALALGQDPAARIAAAHDPAWDEARALALLDTEPARAAVLLTAWGEKRRARPFLQRLDELAVDAAGHALAARLALELGLPDQAVAIARRAGRDGLMLPGAGWPATLQPPPGPVEGAVVLGLIRQESSFDGQATSPVGARGLMQLMPATAAGMARKLGMAADVPALTEDPGYNMKLGSTYLQDLLARFGQALPLALAGYNAGPGRVQDWLTGTDPGADMDAMIDWIEMIPFNETRNYVQRVLENVVIYRARLGSPGPHPLAPNPTLARRG